MKNKLIISYNDIISVDNLLSAWQEFIRGKKSKTDVLLYSINLMDNIFQLYHDLANNIYQHGGYESFYITDPKLRHIHKASVKDRLVHHAVYRKLYPFFAKTFIADSYSCQLGKGTHRAIARFRGFASQVSQNNTRTCWVLQCDIKKFFASIDHDILLNLLNKYIADKNINNLLSNIIYSYEDSSGRGLPLGNLTSQLFVNIYMNKFDQFVKHKIKIKYYIRYADDFVILSNNKLWLMSILQPINDYLKNQLKLNLHPQKVNIKTLSSGIDFLGWVIFPTHMVLRTKTKRRMIKRLKLNPKPESLVSYLGLLKHGNTYELQQKVINDYWFMNNY